MAFTEIALIYERHSPPIRLTVVTGNGSVREKKEERKKSQSSRLELTEKLLMVLRQSRDESHGEGAFIK